MVVEVAPKNALFWLRFGCVVKNFEYVSTVCCYSNRNNMMIDLMCENMLEKYIISSAYVFECETIS